MLSKNILTAARICSPWSSTADERQDTFAANLEAAEEIAQNDAPEHSA